MKAILILNGKIDIQFIENYLSKKSEDVFAVDGAYNLMSNTSIVINGVIGDLDSIHSIPNNIKVIKTSDQNFTDFEKAIHFLIQKNYTEVDVLGASGLEMDHFLGNLHVTSKYLDQINIAFYDPKQRYFLLNTSRTITNCQNRTISLIPFPYVHNLTTTGLQYPISESNLKLGNNISLRNFATHDRVNLTFKHGCIAVFIALHEI